MPLDQTEAIVLRSFNIGRPGQGRRLFFPGQRTAPRRGQGSAEVRQPVRQQPRTDVAGQGLLLRKGTQGPGDSEPDRPDRVLLRGARGFPECLHAGYFAELVEEFFPSRAKEDLVFRLLLSVLQAIKGKRDLEVLTRYFEAWFLQINGLLPDFRRCRKCRKTPDRGRLAVSEDGRRLLRGLHTAQKGSGPGRIRPLPRLDQEKRSLRRKADPPVRPPS